MPLFRYCIPLVACVLAACSDSAPPQRGATADAVRVIVEPLAVEAAATRVEAVGTSRARRSVEIHPATAGEVDDVLFEPGQFVEAGDVLVELDKRDARLAVELAKVRLADAERLFNRYQRSAGSGAVLPTDLDAARTAVEAARIELDRAQVALDDRTIRAPFAGFVDVTDVYPGDRVGPDTLITVLDDRSALLVSFEVPEALIDVLRPGAEVRLSTWQSRDASFVGEVVEVGSRIDARTRTFVARATVDNDADALRPGMSFRVSVTLAGSDYPVVAETAVQWGADGAFVWTVVEGKAQKIPVRIVQRQQGRVLFAGDIVEGDAIIIEGVQRMRPGLDVSYDDASMLSNAGDDAAASDADPG